MGGGDGWGKGSVGGDMEKIKKCGKKRMNCKKILWILTTIGRKLELNNNGNFLLHRYSAVNSFINGTKEKGY